MYLQLRSPALPDQYDYPVVPVTEVFQVEPTDIMQIDPKTEAITRAFEEDKLDHLPKMPLVKAPERVLKSREVINLTVPILSATDKACEEHETYHEGQGIEDFLCPFCREAIRQRTIEETEGIARAEADPVPVGADPALWAIHIYNHLNRHVVRSLCRFCNPNHEAENSEKLRAWRARNKPAVERNDFDETMDAIVKKYSQPKPVKPRTGRSFRDSVDWVDLCRRRNLHIKHKRGEHTALVPEW